MKRVLRWILIGLGAVVTLVVVAVVVMFAIGSWKIGRDYEVQTASLTLMTDSASLADGAHLANIHGCTDCHTPTLGGQVFVDAPPYRVVASNLTSGRGGVGTLYDSPELWDRAIRHGVGLDGEALHVMPSAAFHHLSDADAAKIISFVMRAAPVDSDLPATEIRPLGRILAAFILDADMEVNTEPARQAGPPSGATVEWGEYYAGSICAYCHGAGVRGGQPANPDSPPAPDLAAAGRWTFEQFDQTMRTGVTPGNRVLNPEVMPWPVAAHLTPDEMRGLHMYLASITGATAMR